MRVGIDLDETLADTVGAVCRRRGIPADSWKTWDGPEGYRNPPLLLSLMDGEWWTGKVEPFPGAVEAIQDLGHEVWIVTSRTKPSRASVVRWLAEHRIPHDALVFLDRAEEKLELPIDVLFDDSPHVAQAWKPPTLRLYLIDQPWNREVMDDVGLVRVPNLAEGLKGL